MQRPIVTVGLALLLGCLALPDAALADTIASPAMPAASAQAAVTPAFDPEAATRAYLATVSGEARERSDAYYEGGYWLLLWNALWGLGMAALLMFSGISARIRDWMAARTQRRWLQCLGYAAVYMVLTAILPIPLVIYQDFIREHQYGLSTQTFAEWLHDFAIDELVSFVLLPPALVVLYALLRRARQTWWIWGGGLAVVFIAFVSFIAPVFIQPLLNDYTPLTDGPVRESVLSMARANGVPADNVYMVDASRQTTRISANVSGLGSTIRISLNDNLLKQGTLPEIRAVMGHELGHYVLGHSKFLLLSFGLLCIAGFAFVHYSLIWLLARYGSRWGVSSIDDIASLPAFIGAFTLFFFLATPLTNTIIRSAEAQADIFGLNAAREPDGFATIALKLATYRKLDPSPLEEVIFFEHPSGANRVRMAMHWKAEQLRAAQSPAQTMNTSQ